MREQNPRYQRLTYSLKLTLNRQSGGGVRAPQVQAGCRSCGFGTFTGIPIFYSYCPSCHERLQEKRQLYLGWEAKA